MAKCFKALDESLYGQTIPIFWKFIPDWTRIIKVAELCASYSLAREAKTSLERHEAHPMMYNHGQ